MYISLLFAYFMFFQPSRDTELAKIPDGLLNTIKLQYPQVRQKIQQIVGGVGFLNSVSFLYVYMVNKKFFLSHTKLFAANLIPLCICTVNALKRLDASKQFINFFFR